LIGQCKWSIDAYWDLIRCASEIYLGRIRVDVEELSTRKVMHIEQVVGILKQLKRSVSIVSEWGIYASESVIIAKCARDGKVGITCKCDYWTHTRRANVEL
jgi:hypothetical protein